MLVIGLVIVALGYLLTLLPAAIKAPLTLVGVLILIGWSLVFIFGLLATLAARGVNL